MKKFSTLIIQTLNKLVIEGNKEKEIKTRQIGKEEWSSTALRRRRGL